MSNKKASVSLDVFNPKMTLRELASLLYAMDITAEIRLIPLQRDSILDDAWVRLTEYQKRKGEI